MNTRFFVVWAISWVVWAISWVLSCAIILAWHAYTHPGLVSGAAPEFVRPTDEACIALYGRNGEGLVELDCWQAPDGGHTRLVRP